MYRYSLRVAQDHLTDVPLIDLCKLLHRDPALNTYGMPTIDSVMVQPNFPQAVIETCKAAFASNRVVVGCRAGYHRSPVTAAAAREILMHLGFSVEILEYALVQPDLVRPVTFAAEDMRSISKVFQSTDHKCMIRCTIVWLSYIYT
jgi:hypothetical protein